MTRMNTTTEQEKEAQGMVRLERRLGGFMIHATTDDDGHLTLWVTSCDDSPVVEIDADITESGEFNVRLTTEAIERAYTDIPAQRNP
jgi:hypothetical protein